MEGILIGIKIAQDANRELWYVGVEPQQQCIKLKIGLVERGQISLLYVRQAL